jgi:hypothetical protein
MLKSCEIATNKREEKNVFSKKKGLVVTFMIMSLLLAVLITIARQVPGSLTIMSYIFAVLGIVYFAEMLYRWLMIR